MANNQPSDQEIQFRKRARRRLVGAIALALLMVTVLPMLLDEQETTTTTQPEIAITIPSQEGEDFTSRIVPVDPSDETAPAQESVPTGTAEVVETAAGAGEGPASQSETDGFVVQIGVYSDAANARKLQQKLSAKGLKIYSEKLTADSGVNTRLLMGPYASRSEAEAGLAALKAAGTDGIVKPK